MPIDAAIAAVATLLTKVFGFFVDPDQFGQMQLEHKLEVISAAVRIAILKKDVPAIDQCYTAYRQLSKSITP